MRMRPLGVGLKDKMEKGAFQGKKLSDLKPKDKTEKNSVAPEQSISVSSDAVLKEAQNRIEKVFKEALSQRSSDDRKKESLAFDILNRGPKEVRVAVLDLLSQTILSMADLVGRAHLRNVRQRLVTQHPLENIQVSLDAFADVVENEIFARATPQNYADMIVGQALHLDPQLIVPLRNHLPELIEQHKETWKAKEYKAALEKLDTYQSTIDELESISGNSDSPAQTFYDSIMLRLRLANETPDYNTINHLKKQAVQTLSNSKQELLHQLADLLSAKLNQEKNLVTGETTELLLLTCIRYIEDAGEKIKQHVLNYLSHSDAFYVWANHDGYSGRMKILEILETLETIPTLVAATLRRTQLNPYQPEELKDIIKKLPFAISPGEAWSDAALQDLAKLDDTTQKTWLQFLEHANSNSAKPSNAWENKSKEFLKQLPDFSSTVSRWLTLVGKERSHVLFENNQRFDPWNANILRGLVWALACTEATEGNARACAQLVEISLKKIPGFGPRNPKLATAGTFALGRMNTSFAVAQLARLKARVTFKTTRKEIEKALEDSAKQAGISKEDLEEISVPTFDLETNGIRTEQMGEQRAELRLENNNVQLLFFDAKGKQLKAPPSSLKKDFSDELKELKTAQKDIVGMLTAIKVRLEKLQLSQKTWSAKDWQERYAQHPLVGQIAQRLIWTIDGTPVAFHPTRGLEDIHGQAQVLKDTMRVALWHPIFFETNTVLAWREWLHAANIVQPWKQAHREIYVLTEAERRTNTYSNRFAAHIIKQHQFAQLASVRGWKNKLRLMVDDTYPPATLELPEWNLRAEFWIEGIGDNYGTDTNETGTYLRLVTDQVRFYPITAPQNSAHASGGGYEMWLHNGTDPAQPIALEYVPALVLSEVLRDVDLFVGVCSVGNDPTWQDGGPEGRYREYWQSYSFGDLNATAVTRKEMLEILLPRLKIKDRVSLDGKFLRVRGDIRNYKIHLGSSNILMEPNDQYLCIVPNSNSGNNENLQLPFEGDRTLAVILSKAFLLAADTKITDVTITRQIKER